MSRKTRPWLKLRSKSQPDRPLRPPLWMGNRSNTEYFHQATREERLIHKIVLERADEKARKLGVDRREFLASSMGMMTTLAVINQVSGCGGDDGMGTVRMNPADANTGRRSNPAMSGGGGRGGRTAVPDSMRGGVDAGARSSNPMTPPRGGMPPTGSGAADAGRIVDAGAPDAGSGSSCPYVVPTEATCEETDLLSGDEFIFDIQTHSFDDGEWRTRNATYADFLGLLASCTGVQNQLDCFDEDHYGELMFVDSDTTVSVITSWPASVCTEDGPMVCGLPLSNEGMRKLRDSINQKARSQRVVNQVQVMPNDRWEIQRDIMTMTVEDPTWGAVSWKAYPGWGPSSSGGIGGSGYFLNEEIGSRFIEHGLSLGVPNFAIHKGLPIPGFDVEHNQPIEIGQTAKQFPDANLIIYHSGIGGGTDSLLGVSSYETSPFDESVEDPAAHTGLDQLIASLRQAGIGPGDNVYAELGSAWSNVMNNATAAQHFIGKLLKYVGEDNIVWGTDCILYGSPQGQIEAFRMFQITEEFQDRYGYPALTPRIKAKIFGLNAARIFCIDPEEKRCRMQASDFAAMQRMYDAELGPRRWTIQEPLGPTTRREFLQLARVNIKKGQPGS